MKRVPAALVVLVALTLVACNQADIPEINEEVAVVETPVATELPPAIPTFTATPATATPTKGPPTPTATPVVLTPTPTASATPLPVAFQIHVVEQFDTLLQIAVDYNVSYEDLLRVNGIDENDFLQLGQEIVIPTGSTARVNSNGASASEPEAAEAGADSASSPNQAGQAPAETISDSAAEPAAPAPPPAPVAAAPPPPKINHPANINPLTGLPVDDPALLRRRPLLVRIGNDVGARRAQVGLNSADIVYEEITEWWVTRFTAIFLSNTPTTISPVRSARLINVQLAPQYQGALAHSGGSDGVRWEISQAPVANLDEFYNMAPYFYRPNEGWQTRLAIDAVAARDYLIAKGMDAPVTQNGFTFSDAPEGGEPGEDIFIPYPSATSFTEWHYDAGSGKYLRWINGAPLVDAGDGNQVAAANVIVYFAEHQQTDIVEDSNGMTSIRIIINGTGPAWMFRDGVLSRGTWQSDGASTPFFRNEDGSPYALKPGNTWVEVVPTYYTIGLNSPDEASSR